MTQKIAKVKLDSLNELSYNPRIISEEEITRLKASIKEHTKAIPEDQRGGGFRLVTTITVNSQGNRIIGGHQRTKALKEMGQSWIDGRDITWVDVAPDSPLEKSLNVSLNSMRLMGEWDEEKLESILSDIKVDAPDLFESLDFPDIEIYVDVPDVSDTVSDPEPTEEEPEKDTKTKDKLKDKDGNQSLDVSDDEDEFDESTGGASLFPISYAVSSDQRNAIKAAVTKSKKANKIDSDTEALVCICEQYVKKEDGDE